MNMGPIYIADFVSSLWGNLNKPNNGRPITCPVYFKHFLKVVCSQHFAA